MPVKISLPDFRQWLQDSFEVDGLTGQPVIPRLSTMKSPNAKDHLAATRRVAICKTTVCRPIINRTVKQSS